MSNKLLFSSILTILILEINNPLKAQEVNNSLIYKFCIAALKSKRDLTNKQNFNEISHFTCGCFFKRFKSGNSLNKSRIYCRDKASKRYNL